MGDDALPPPCPCTMLSNRLFDFLQTTTFNADDDANVLRKAMKGLGILVQRLRSVDFLGSLTKSQVLSLSLMESLVFSISQVRSHVFCINLLRFHVQHVTRYYV